jgi:hypothetical protein
MRAPHSSATIQPAFVVAEAAMTQPNTVLVRSHLGCRLEVQDDGGQGWIVRIHDPRGAVSLTLKNRVPNGLEPLLAEARQQVDRAYGIVERPGW